MFEESVIWNKSPVWEAFAEIATPYKAGFVGDTSTSGPLKYPLLSIFARTAPVELCHSCTAEVCEAIGLSIKFGLVVEFVFIINGSDDVNDFVELTQLNVLSVAPFIVIPAPSAVVSVGVATSAIIIFLSSITRLVELRFVVVPFTVKLPDNVKSFAVIFPR